MENRRMKFYSKESNKVAIRAIPGHFATSHSHINYYIDITGSKTRAKEAREIANLLYQKIGQLSYVDTIVCMDGTEVIGAFLADAFEKGEVLSTNRHETIYVVAPEVNNSNQIIFRDNIKPSIYGKHVVLLAATASTGKTIRRSVEGINYYGGIVDAVASVFSTVEKIDDMPVISVFTEDDLPGYTAYQVQDCPFCRQGQRIEAVVNGFGYSKL